MQPPFKAIRELLEDTWLGSEEEKERLRQMKTGELLDLYAKSGGGYIDGHVLPVRMLLARRQVQDWLEACGEDNEAVAQAQVEKEQIAKQVAHELAHRACGEDVRSYLRVVKPL